MSDLEEEMRRALFGSESASVPLQPLAPASPVSKPKSKVRSPKVRVTLEVSKDFEGKTERFIYEADTLSTLTAEIDAKSAARKLKFKYFHVISIEATE